MRPGSSLGCSQYIVEDGQYGYSMVSRITLSGQLTQLCISNEVCIKEEISELRAGRIGKQRKGKKVESAQAQGMLWAEIQVWEHCISVALYIIQHDKSFHAGKGM